MTPAELLAFAEELDIENCGTMRKQDIMFSVLKRLAERDVPISGTGVLEVLQDGFGFLRSPEENYLPGPDDIYVSPNQIRRFGLKKGDTVEGQIRAPKAGERYFALLKRSTTPPTKYDLIPAIKSNFYRFAHSRIKKYTLKINSLGSRRFALLQHLY